MTHIVRSFDEELTTLKNDLGRMGVEVAALFAWSLQALARRDEPLAERIIAADEAIDRLYEKIQEQVVRLLALRAPMADDLRLVVTALKASSTLERVGDYAVNIAKRSIVLHELPQIRSVRSVERMGKRVHALLDEVLIALSTADAEKAMAVWKADQEVDDMHASLFRELLSYMIEDSRNIAACSHLLFISKNIERVGDLATNIGEMVQFLVTGTAVTEARPKGDLPVAPGES